MKSPVDVLRAKELELEKVRKEVEALRMTVEILKDKQPEQLTRKISKVVQLP